MVNIKLILSYDGTNYCGFQIQKNGPTIQGILEQALAKRTGESIRIIGGSRTDSGVHARGQVVNFHTKSTIPPAAFAPALNSLLPPDIVIRHSRRVPEEFHARYSAKGKVYHYLINTRQRPLPFERHHSWQLGGPLDLRAMEMAARFLEGRHDFRGFQAVGSPVKSTIRTIKKVFIRARGPLVILSFHGDGFLYRQVRNMVGTLVAIGQGRMSPGVIPEIIAGQDRSAAGPTAPPQGLFLGRIFYP